MADGDSSVAKVGRPTVITDEVVGKLTSIFKLGVTDVTACRYAKISRDAFYDHLKSDLEFSDKIEESKEFARIAAGQVVIDAIVENKDVATAKWWLEKKYPDEFGDKSIQVNVLQQFNLGRDNEELMELAK